MSSLLLTIKTMPSKFSSAITRFKKDKSGLSAMEFALILPILLMTYLGTIEISQALTVSRNTTTIASTVADLIGQTTSLSSSDLTKIFNASISLMAPHNPNNIKIHASSFCKKLNNNTIIRDWDQSHNGLSSTINTSHASVVALLPNNGDSVIVAEAEYTYNLISPAKSIFTAFGYGFGGSGTSNGGFIIRDQFFVRPRNISFVTKDNNSQCNQ